MSRARGGTAASSTGLTTSASARTRLWQTLVLALTAVVATVMLLLGVWQMSVYRTQGAQNLQKRASAAPVSLDAELAHDDAVGRLYGLQVRLHGHYLPLRASVVGTRAPYRVVAPFQDGTRVVGVVRGTVDSPTSVVPEPPTGDLDQVGVLMPSEGSGNAADAGPHGTMPRVNLERLAQSWPSGTLAGFVTLSDADARAQHLAPATVTMPDNASGRAQNLGYAIQWWVFAVFAVAMGLVFSRTIGRRQRPVESA